MELIIQPNPVALSLAIPALISGGLAVYAFILPRVVGSRTFAFLMLAVCVWSFFYGVELSCLSLECMLASIMMEYLGIAAVPVLWLILTLLYTGREKWVTRRNVILLFVIPSITIVMVATNQMHHLYYSSAGVAIGGPFPMMAITRGPWYWVNSTYSYAALLIATVLLIAQLWKPGAIFRKQVIAMLVGVSLPWIVNFLYVAFGWMLFGHVDPTPFAFTFAGMVMAWSIFRYRLFDIVPMAYDMVIDSMDDAIVVLDRQHRIVGFNRGAYKLFGLSRASIGQLAIAIWKEWPALLSLSGSGETARIEIVSIRQDSICHYEVSAYEVADRHENITGQVISLRDITDRKRAENQVQERIKELQAFYSLSELNSREGISLDNLYQEMANMLPSSWQYPETACARVVIGDREFRTKNFVDSIWTLSSPVKVHGTKVGRIDVGYIEERPGLDEGPFLNEERRLLNALAERIGYITERRQTEEALRNAEEKYRLLVENINDIFYMLDNQGNITFISPAVERLTLYKMSELVGKPVFPLVHPDDLPGLLESFNQLVSGQLVPWEFRLLDKDGRVIFVRTSRQLLYKDGKVIGITAVMTDMTERKQMEQKLEEMATHDFLTGLPNRVLLTDRFTMSAALAQRNKERLAVMSLDLDRFKTINDTLGHEAGDQVLKTISTRLTAIIRASDTLARIGGDEFILVMLETNHPKDATAIAKKILAAFKEPLLIDGHQVLLSTSIGIATYPEEGQDMETLVKKSDAALYYSKGHGRNQFKFFGDGDVKVGGDHKSAN